MKSRLKQMRRVAEMRVLRERICEAASVRTAGQLRMTERSLHETALARYAAIHEGREAVAQGDRSAWLLADAMREVADWNTTQLETLRKQRETEFNAAAEIFRGSRIQREQSDRIVESMQAALTIAEERQEQARSDDRFSARMHWNAAQATMKER